MSNHDVTTGALALLLRHDLTGCLQAGHQAARLLERLAETGTLDRTTRELCLLMSDRLLASSATSRTTTNCMSRR